MPIFSFAPVRHFTHIRQTTGPHLMIYRSGRQGRYIPHLYDLVHFAWWEPYDLHGLAHAFWVGSELLRINTQVLHNIS